MFTLTGHTINGGTFLDECSARRRKFILTTHNNQKRQTSMPPRGFEPATLACERPQTQSLDRSATGNGDCNIYLIEVMTSQFCNFYQGNRAVTLASFLKIGLKDLFLPGILAKYYVVFFFPLTRLNIVFKLSYSVTLTILHLFTSFRDI
jgi:hypothetical protein